MPGGNGNLCYNFPPWFVCLRQINVKAPEASEAASTNILYIAIYLLAGENTCQGEKKAFIIKELQHIQKVLIEATTH